MSEKIKIFGLGGLDEDGKNCTVVEVNGDNTSGGAGNLIHKSARLAEENILGILGILRYFNIADLTAVIQVREDSAYHVFKSCRG